MLSESQRQEISPANQINAIILKNVTNGVRINTSIHFTDLQSMVLIHTHVYSTICTAYSSIADSG